MRSPSIPAGVRPILLSSLVAIALSLLGQRAAIVGTVLPGSSPRKLAAPVRGRSTLISEEKTSLLSSLLGYDSARPATAGPGKRAAYTAGSGHRLAAVRTTPLTGRVFSPDAPQRSDGSSGAAVG